MLKLARIIALTFSIGVGYGVAAAGMAHGAEVFLASGKVLRGAVEVRGGAFKVGGQPVSASEILAVRMARAPAPERLPSGVFVRGGSLLSGTLESLKGEAVSVTATSLGKSLALKIDDLAGAFFPLAPGQPENFPALGRYALLRAATDLDRLALEKKTDGAEKDESGGGTLRPGMRNRITYPNLDGLDGKLMRLGGTHAIINLVSGKTITPKRSVLRLVEFQVPPLPPAKGREMMVRLKAGDQLRGQIVNLDAKHLTLATTFAGNLEIAVETLAVIYPAGSASIQWLSSKRPLVDQQVSLFDAQFPSRMDLSCDGRLIHLNGLPCDKGIGVHSQAILSWNVKGGPGKKFVALVGIDDETHKRGAAEASVLVDGEAVWQSGPLKGGEDPKPVVVDLAKAQKLTLRVSFGPDGDDSGDHVGWGWAAITGK